MWLFINSFILYFYWRSTDLGKAERFRIFTLLKILSTFPIKAKPGRTATSAVKLAKVKPVFKAGALVPIKSHTEFKESPDSG